MNVKQTYRFAALIAAMAAGQAHAVPTFTMSDAGLANAQAAEASFLSGLGTDFITEDFEGFTAKTLSKSFATAVGTFSQELAGFSGACEPNCDKGLAILDKKTTPFSGRYAIESKNWLDSWDSQHTRLTLDGLATSVGFYMTDPNDAGGRFSLSLSDGNDTQVEFSDIFGSSLGNGKVYYLSFFAVEGIKEINIFSNNKDDGFGIDNVSIQTVKPAADVPEPATMGLIGIGIAALALGRRRRA